MSSGLLWGPAFPDADQPGITIAAVAAILELTNVVEDSDSALTFAYLRARTPGADGNSILVEFAGNALTEAGDFEEDAGADPPTIVVRFVPGGTTVDDIYALLQSSALVELRGIWQPSDALRSTDAFPPTSMYGGADAYQDHGSYWGPMIPDGPDSSLVAPGLSKAAAAFLLALQPGASLALEWRTSVSKSDAGLEQRSSTIDYPRARLQGSAHLVDGRRAVAARANLQQLAASGARFRLTLPHESATVVAVDGATLTLHTRPEGPFLGPSGPLRDWANIGQNVAVYSPDGEAVEEFVIQALGAGDTLELDRAPTVAEPGSEIVPALDVYLEAQQAFRRAPYSLAEAGAPDGGLETWEISAHEAELGFPIAAVAARISLADPTTTGALQGAFLVALQPGEGGNAYTAQFVSGSPTGAVDVYDDDQTVVVFEDGVSTVGDLEDALGADSTRLRLAGEFDRDDVLTTATDVFGPSSLAGGAEEQPGTMGRGAAISHWNGRPLWDRGIDVEDAAEDTMHAMTRLLDLGAAPVAIGSATVPDWGRAVGIHRADAGAEWQWFKSFLSATTGRHRSFYLPTYREDLRAVGGGPGGAPGAGVSGLIRVDAAWGDFYTWWPGPQGTKLIAVFQGDEMRVVEVTDALDLGDGSIQLTIRTDPGNVDATLPTTDDIEGISWVELCRWESDTFEIEWSGARFSFDGTARAVQR